MTVGYEIMVTCFIHLKSSFDRSEDSPVHVPSILRLAGVIVDNNYNEKFSFDEFIKPETSISKECLNLLSIKESQLDKALSINMVFKEIINVFQRHDVNSIASWGVSHRTLLINNLNSIREADNSYRQTFSTMNYQDLQHQFCQSRPFKIQPVGLKMACRLSDIDYIGDQLSPLDDAYNSLAIAKQMQKNPNLCKATA